jgi:N-acetylglucosamine transport system permease protein
VKLPRSFIALFLAPACVIYGGFVLWPLLQALQFSMYRWRGVSAKKKFIGVDNFVELGQDGVFWQAIRNNIFLLLGAGFFVVVIGLILAHATSEKSRSARNLRGVMLFPQVISLVAVATMWQFILNPEGLLNAGLRAVGLKGMAKTWLGNPLFALPAIGLAFVWFAAGFYGLLFSAGIRQIPEEVNEAAELDGSKGWHRFSRITWPLIWSVRRTALTYLVINIMNTFALVLLMTQGGPDRASESLLTYIYEQAFKNSKFGYATSISIAAFALTLVLSGGLMFIMRRDPTEPARVQL